MNYSDQEIEAHEVKEEQWEFVAKKKGLLCKRCELPPLFHERDIYFDTGYCGYCSYQFDKLEAE